MNSYSFTSLIRIGETGFLTVILNESADGVKDLCFVNERSFAAAQDDTSLALLMHCPLNFTYVFTIPEIGRGQPRTNTDK